MVSTVCIPTQERGNENKAEFEGQLEEEAELNQRIMENLAKVKL